MKFRIFLFDLQSKENKKIMEDGLSLKMHYEKHSEK